ncbi:MAG TPA: hypothetical protein VG826_19525, partial [Pirellulales bacterium]|nr:hypothetical protein [Pirellulales bacterium]
MGTIGKSRVGRPSLGSLFAVRGRVGVLIALIPLAACAAEQAEQIPLWPNGPPGFESRKDEPERAESYWVKNIHQPS